MLFLSIDFGTSAVKAALVNEKAEILAHASEQYDYIMLPGEKSEIDPNQLFDALFKAVNRLDATERQKVEWLCYDTFSPSPVFLNQEGEMVYQNIITHMDRRSRAQSKDIDRIFTNDGYLNIAGLYPFAGGCSAMTFLWFLKNEPDVLKKTSTIGHLPTLVHHRLTGKRAIDLVNASMMGVYETVGQKGWSEQLINGLGLEMRWFPEIVNPGVHHGDLKKDMAEKLGVKTGIPVSMGSNDAAVAHLGAGNQKAGDSIITAGSSEMITILTDQPKVNPKYYLRNAALPGLWQVYATTSGGFGVDWFYREFCKEMGKEEYFAYISRCLDDPEGAGGVRFSPYLTGDRQSLRKKTAGWNGLTLGATRDQMLYALYEGIQQVLYGTMLLAEENVTLDRNVKITGGMVSDSYLRFKQKFLPGFDFVQVDDCPIKGNVVLAQKTN